MFVRICTYLQISSVSTPEEVHVCTSVYLEQPPACVEIFDAFQVARRQLDVGWTESGRQLVHVCYVILNRSDLFLELLQYAHTHTHKHTLFVMLHCLQW